MLPRYVVNKKPNVEQCLKKGMESTEHIYIFACIITEMGKKNTQENGSTHFL